jgi:hypothetical protein
MPIRINLKEIFPSDSQDITVDKLNFNFNKLLALGVGDQGEIGAAGSQGAAGPVGLSGLQGLRGSTWFVDAGDPNSLTFVDLIDQDLYLDTITFSVWQYDEATTTWTQVLNFSSIINYYISLSPSPFNRGFGIGSPQDDRFITFNRRGNDYVNSQNDITRGSFNTADSDILLLTNFNESTIANAIGFPNFPASSGDMFDALLKVYVNHSEGASEVTGRYHLEMGSLYLDQSSPAEPTLSLLKHNMKSKFKKNDVTLTTGIPSTNAWVNIAQFSLSVPEPEPITGIDQNGIFEFVMPKWNNEGTTIQDEVRVWMGSAEGMSEYVGLTEKEIGDGIVITDLTTAASFGIMKGLGNKFNVNYTNDDFFLINTNGLDGVFINSKLVQTNGTLDVIHTNEARFVSKALNNVAFDSNTNKDLSSAFSNGKILITTWAGQVPVLGSETDDRGYIRIHQVSSDFTQILNASFDSQYSTSGSPIYDNHGHQINQQYDDFWTTNLTHVDVVGKYLYATRIRPQSTITLVGTRSLYSTLIIAELDSSGFGLQPIGYWGAASPDPWNPTPIDDECYAKKVQVVGSTAYVLTKKQATSDWTATDSYLRAIDVTDPTNPTEVDNVTTTSDDNYLDFVILGERAFISSYDDSSNSIKIIKVDVHDPSNLVAGSSTTVVASGATEKPAPIKAEGQRVYLGYGNKIYAYRPTDLNINAMTGASLISGGFTVDADLRISDIIVNGNYMYVLGENTSTGFGELYTLDITTIATPIVVGFDSRSTLTAPGKMTLVGNKIYATSSQGTGGLSTTDGGISIFELDGLVSPTASISAIKSNEVKVSNNVYVGEKLDVGNSINVGSGGVYIDEGAGLAVDGPTTILGRVELHSGDVSFKQFSRVKVSKSTSQTIASDLVVEQVVDFDVEDYDSLSEFNLTSNQFTVTYSGYYTFEFRSYLRHSDIVTPQEHIFASNATSILVNGTDTYLFNLLWQSQTSSTGAIIKSYHRYTIGGSKTVYLDAGDTVQVKVQSYALDDSATVINLGIYASELTINRIG